MKILQKIFLGFFVAAVIFVILYMLGPKLEPITLTVHYPEVGNTSNLENYLKQREDSVIGLKPGNEAYIVWADSTQKVKTPYSIVYIHGFGASPMEGDPVHRFLAAHFGANLFVTRLPEHGIKRENGMEYLSAEALADAAGEAYAIGQELGEEVIVVGTSMGGALTLLLGSQQPEIKALVTYSPAIRDQGERLNNFYTPWLEKLMEVTASTNGVVQQTRTGEKKLYWSEEYHMHGYESLAQLMYSEMNAETFAKIEQPLFLGYYYKSDEEQDPVVSVPKMLEMYEAVSTPGRLKVKQAFPNAGDHVIASSITSGDWEGVLFATIDFLEEIVGMTPADQFADLDLKKEVALE
ncbi:alpha/beta hydrolase [Algoriphagus namhaensis]